MAQPNRSHISLTKLEKKNLIHGIITQNVDRLHHKSGSINIIELHGRGDRVQCTTCSNEKDRVIYQEELQEYNNDWLKTILGRKFETTADGDAILDNVDTSRFEIIPCDNCNIGIMKPMYVFFGGSVPQDISDAANELIQKSKMLLLIGTTVSTYSCFRLVRLARENQSVIYIINNGTTRVDSLADGIFSGPSCGEFLEQLCDLSNADTNTSSKEMA